MSASFAPKRQSPQLRQPSTTRAMMLDVMVALTPALGMAVFFFGLRALALTAVSVGSCVLFEVLYRLLTRQRQSVGDLSACVTGLLLALSLPASTPYWVPVMGAAFGIIVVKQFYGGLGRNFMNPALAGRMEEPFLLLLEGAAAPGVFWRGEAALAAVLLLADIVLLALLTRGCGALWRGLIPKWRGRGLWLLTAAAFWWAGVQPAEPVGEGVLLWGGLLLGGVVPAFAVLTERGSKTEKGGATSCVKK